jgi:riboflavin synthase
MFTGLIQGLGQIKKKGAIGSSMGDAGARWIISIPLAPPKIGASIAINGVCSTVVTCKNGDTTGITVDYLPETLKKTTFNQLTEGDYVNVEPALKYGDEIGGHLMTGHIDTTGNITDIENQGEFHRLRISYPPAFSKYLISKGSIAIEGISLTVVMDDEISQQSHFDVHIIPHTWKHTNLQYLSIGNAVNLEFDQAGKYAVRQKMV